MSKSGGGWAWMLGAIVFLLCLNAAYALIELVVRGPQVSINVLSFVGEVCYVSVSLYVLLSMLVATVSFGFFCSFLMRRLAVGTVDAEMLESLETKVQNIRGQLEKVIAKRFAKFSIDDFTITKGLKNIESQLDENRRCMERIDRTRDKYGKSVKRQSVALEEIRERIGEMEARLMPKPLLTSRSDIREVSGVGEKIAEELRSVGVTNVEGLIIEDPAVLARRTGLSKKKIEKLQRTVQLLMIPGVDEGRAKLLQKAGVTSADRLAGQNSILLFKRVAGVGENVDDVPTLEEIASYIQYARFNFSVFR